MTCIDCGDDVHPRRAALGYKVCISCGEIRARKVKHCSVPLSKSNYYYVSNREILKQTNPKRT